MKNSARETVDGLNHLASLFEHARANARQGGGALSGWIETAIGAMRDLAPGVAAARGGPYHGAVMQAALNAKQSHDALAAVIESEVARLSHEIHQLGAGAEATAQYGRRGAQGAAVLDRVG